MAACPCSSVLRSEGNQLWPTTQVAAREEAHDTLINFMKLCRELDEIELRSIVFITKT